MGVRKSVFGSPSEKRGFRALQHQWGSCYRLYPQLPFFAVFEPDDTIRDTSNFLFKTSIDYTFCGRNDRPLMAIDFGGMGRGFSRRARYVRVKRTVDRYRKVKFELKLTFAGRHGFPYYIIVSYDEFEPVGEHTHLTVVDGIIGQVLARAAFTTRIQDVVVEQRLAIDRLPADERHEIVQQLVIDEEAESELAYDPIAQRAAQVLNELSASGCEIKTWSYRYFEEPDLPVPDYKNQTTMLPTLESLKARIAAMENVTEIGCVCTLGTNIGEVSEVVSICNVGDIGSASVVLRNIVDMLVYGKALRLVKRRRSASASE